MHAIVLQAQQEAITTIKPGIAASSIHHLTHEIIDNSEFAGCFIHSTGHSLGLNVHDVGIGLHGQTQSALETKMILTVEPGIYLPGYGGVRIEDDICVTDEGCMILTESKRDLIEI
jgi:Xaa-Pro aminopeptidase